MVGDAVGALVVGFASLALAWAFESVSDLALMSGAVKALAWAFESVSDLALVSGEVKVFLLTTR